MIYILISRKKRLRYKTSAAAIAKDNNLEINLEDWDQIWNLLDKYSETYYVYVIGEANADRVKIGKSKQPGVRLKQLQTAYPSKLFLWAFCKETSDFNEKDLHKWYSHLKVEGEWFLRNKEIDDLVLQIKGKSNQ